MSILSEGEKSCLIQSAKEYDYIRMCWPDVHGIPRGKTIVGRYAEDAIRDGYSIFSGKSRLTIIWQNNDPSPQSNLI